MISGQLFNRCPIERFSKDQREVTMKWARLLMVLTLAFSITGCGKSKQKKKDHDKDHDKVVQPLKIEPDDESEDESSE